MGAASRPLRLSSNRVRQFARRGFGRTLSLGAQHSAARQLLGQPAGEPVGERARVKLMIIIILIMIITLARYTSAHLVTLFLCFSLRGRLSLCSGAPRAASPAGGLSNGRSHAHTSGARRARVCAGARAAGWPARQLAGRDADCCGPSGEPIRRRAHLCGHSNLGAAPIELRAGRTTTAVRQSGACRSASSQQQRSRMMMMMIVSGGGGPND